jgi:hypothetical protein
MNAEKHAKARLAEAVKTVSRAWGHGFNRLGEGQQEALVRAEMLSDVHRAQGLGDAATYRELTEAMVEAAIMWKPEGFNR